MPAPEENELLTRTGPGTLMGNLLRQYWLPATLSSELPRPDCAPVRVMLLGERLIAFRDSKGQVGLLAESCPHRGASLFFGLNEDCGLRCAYHGWKFDVSGHCVDMPQEPSESELKPRVRARAYPCRERGGLVWAYLGPRAEPPPLPGLDFRGSDADSCVVSATLLDSNWLQHLESDLDIYHLRHLHQGYLDLGRRLAGRPASAPATIEHSERTPASRMETADTECGFAFAACEEVAPGGNLCWGIGQFMFPFFAMLPQGDLGSKWVVCRVPMDDTHTMTFGIVRKESSVPHELFFGPEPSHLDNGPGWFERFRLARNQGNDFQLDRRRQRERESVAFGTGILGQVVQDAAVVWSQGEIAPRDSEHLVSGDAAVIRVRQRLIQAARALAEHGDAPPGVDQPEAYRQKHGSIVIPRSASWVEALRARRR